MLLNKQDHKIILKKKNGRLFENIPARVQFPIIFITDSTLPVEEGDEIQFTPSNNLTERYTVIDRGFKNAQGSFPAHYQVKVKRKI